MIKIGILGIAHTHGYSYVRQINQMQDAQVTGLYEENTEFAKRAAAELKLKLYSSPQELLDSCDAVIIASENSKHMKYTEMAALKHKHVL
ncbi:MAG TPA: Gfo/Idh/MocA family oxidoreductase, partial [Petrotogaceae bacterium]|nr:Gfo/Idh/MocA family oxidoreductase [Petrotogaceae bacterium]